MLTPDLDSATWRKSSYSGGNGTCVEVGFAAAVIAVRDTKDSESGTLAVSSERWSAFVVGIKRGAFDPR